jgi:hypothetical protein
MKLVFGARHLKFASLVLKPQSGPGPEGWQRRTISAMAFGNPPSGMIADPERHARDSQLATCGTAARSAVADRVP